MDLPGGRVAAGATAAVLAAAAAEVVLVDQIGTWTGITLVAVSIAAALVTRAGDRSLAAMMPPLAFMAAVLTAGQALLPDDGSDLREREIVMILDVLGSNAAWVLAATACAVVIATIGHVRDRRRGARPASA